MPIRVLTLLTVLAFSQTLFAAEPLAHRWLYLQLNLQVEENVGKAESLLERAKKAGYTAVVLADYKLNILDRVPDHYFKHAKRFKEAADRLGLEIIPAVCSFGYSEGILAHDPNLAEGLPARDVPLALTAGKVHAVQNPRTAIPGDFEAHRNHTFAGWDFQDEPVVGTFADTETVHGGKISLRIENPKDKTGENRRVSKMIPVQKWGQYHASVWIKTEGFESAADTRLFAMSPNGRTLSFSNLGVKRDQDWTEHHIVFNSLDNEQVRIYIGVWGAGLGKLWMDDAKVESAPFVNMVRRPGCPLRISIEDGRELVEGRDFKEFRDPKMAVEPWVGHFDVYHEPPQLEILPAAKLSQNAKLRASFYHAVTVYDEQVPCSLSEPAVFDVVRDQCQRVEQLFHPQTWFLSHDEIRVANWSATEKKAGQSAGKVLAGNVKKCVEIVREISPEAKFAIWSDMFDPHHNALPEYYLVNGDLAGAWEGIPKDAIIVNWNSGKAKESTHFFADRGHRQVLAGYYDAPVERIRDWLREAGDADISGVMYTTWKARFEDLETFAQAVDK